MNPHREWFCEYEKYNEGDVFLGDHSITKITGCRRVKLLLKDGKIKTLPSVLHIPYLAKNLISISKMSNVGAHTIFEKDICKMVPGEMVLMRGVRCGTLYKMLGRTTIDGYNNSIVFERKKEERKVPYVYGGDTMLLCYGNKYLHILERRVFNHYQVKVWLKVCLITI